MIQRLRLQNWRAYESLDLELGPGATFVVAANGIGKSSLIMGAAWGLFGDISGVKGVEEIRGDADDATVRLDLRLPSGADLTITRSIKRTGRVDVRADLGSRSLNSQTELDMVFTDEFGADSHILAQLVVMMHGGALESFYGEFDLRDHLAKVFGVSSLFEAATITKGMAERAASGLRKLKSTRRTEKRQREQLHAELQSTDVDLEKVRKAQARAKMDVGDLEDVIRLGQEWSRFQARVAERERRLRGVTEQASDLLGRPINFESVKELLEDAERSLGESVSSFEGEAAMARGKSEVIGATMSTLGDAKTVCPTCLRPLSEHESVRAAEEHRKHLNRLSAIIATAENEAKTRRARLSAVRQLLRQIHEQPLPLEPESETSRQRLDGAMRELAKKKAEIEELDKQSAQLLAARRSVKEALNRFDEDEARNRELEALYREEALGIAAHEAFENSGEAIARQYIEPLAREVEMRWKRIFGSSGLSLSPEGRITRQVGTRVLKFESLSGGEKVWALLLARLVIAGASTRAPFVWLDEPLEHLDPRLRKVVAGTLAKASSGGGLRQVIVTTYESELARQLMEDVPSASLLYVTVSQ